MVLATVDAYGAPSFGIRPGTEQIITHTPENAGGVGIDAAIAVARWQATAGNTSRGSYNGILGHRGSDNPASCTTEDHWVMVRSVPWNRAAGGVTTNRDPSVWAPGRHPWMKQMLSPAAYADVNAYAIQIALAGTAAWYNANGYPVGLLKSYARWVKTLEGAYKFDAVMTEHRYWQLNRSDPGTTGFTAKMLDRYNAMFNAPAPAPKPEPTPTPPPPSPTELELARRAIAGLEGRIGAKNDGIDAAIAALQAARSK